MTRRLKPRVVHWLYVAIIRLSVTFASLVWWPGCPTASAKRKLSRVQRLACLGITVAMRTTPTNAVEALIYLPPLDLVVQTNGGVTCESKHRVSPSLLLWRGALLRVTTFESHLTEITVN